MYFLGRLGGKSRRSPRRLPPAAVPQRLDVEASNDRDRFHHRHPRLRRAVPRTRHRAQTAKATRRLYPFKCSSDDRFTGDRTAALDQGLHVSPSLHGYTRGAAERREETTRRRPDDDSHRVRLITDVFPLAIPESWQEGNQPGPPRLDPTASGKIPTRH